MTPAERAKLIVLAEPEKLEQLIAEHILDATRELLDRLGTSAICAACGCAVYWIQTINGRRRTPYSIRGVPHTEDCNMIGRPGRLGRWTDKTTT